MSEEQLRAVQRPAELACEEEYPAILRGLAGEAEALLATCPTAQAADFVRAVGRRRWMSRFADYWNIPEDEQLTRREVAHIDRFLTQVFAAVRDASVQDAQA